MNRAAGRLGGALLLIAAAAAAQAPPDPIAAGRREFNSRCAGCHGTDGTGGERAGAIGERRGARLDSEQAVRDLIRRGMPAFALPDAELNRLSAFVRSRVAPAGDLRVPGNPTNGEAYFFGAGRCSTCHMVRGRGGLRGPDLTEAGQRLTLADLETALDHPGSRRVPGFTAATVVLRSGVTLRGFIRNESGFDLQLLGFDRKLHLLRSEDIARVERDGQSMMPALTAGADARRDLLAYLAQLPGGEAPAASAGAELPDAVTWDRIVHPESGEWPTYHGTLGGNRHTTLTQITPENVAGLAPRWEFPVPGSRNLEVTPVVVGGVMYVTTVNSVFALDAGTGRQIWQYNRARSRGLIGDAAGGINRGVAVRGDRVFVVTDNAHLLALHRLTGGLLWDVEMADSRQHYGATSAPLVVDDLVISGTSGGDEGIRGFVSAYRVSDGRRAWRFWTIPAPGDPAAATWKGRAMEHGCGSTWLTGTYDPETGLLFWPTGNPCPDFNGDERQGDNLYTDSVLALDPKTGALKWHYQFTPHDLHDWDAAETPMVVDAAYRGRPRRLLLQGNRNGFFYVLDRETGAFLSAVPFVRLLTWAKGIGPDGRPIWAEGWQPTAAGTKVCPSMDGATNWMSTAYNSSTGLFYLMALEKCNIYSKSPEWWKPGRSFYGGSAREAEEIPRKYLRALNLQTGKIAWEYAQTGPGEAWAGLLSTASGLLFFGDDNGAFAAVNAADGKALWHCQLNARWKASPMTYLARGRQYVAIAAGDRVVAFGLP